ncbi:hypothetical protein [Mycolicibacter sinensis]|uniref:hypothetical protein n=1 Tax=Mycolicibacter sinensis (strain JDM601) TaxID=875328 RepID=UPI0007EBC82C|nr:hypothetical protein [Mycolicibacter sinensis]OBH20426.1 hypothetical protein A5694_16395 [Mycolicibacter sinensis]
MREKKFTWDARGAVAAGIATIALIATMLAPAVWAPLVSIANTLAVALALRPRQRWDRWDGAAVVVAGAAVLIVLIAPLTAPIVGIASALVIALTLRRR